MTAFPTPSNPPSVPDQNLILTWLFSLASIVRSMLTGKLNATGTVTLTANSATTTLTDARLSVDSLVVFDPMTANAATELYGATMYVLTANRTNGVFTITNANNANADRTFKYLIIG